MTALVAKTAELPAEDKKKKTAKGKKKVYVMGGRSSRGDRCATKNSYVGGWGGCVVKVGNTLGRSSITWRLPPRRNRYYIFKDPLLASLRFVFPQPLSPEEQRSNELQAALVKTVGEKLDAKTAALTEVGKKLDAKLTASEAESNSGRGSGDVELLRGELVAVKADVKELREEVKGLTTQLEEGFTKTCTFLSSHM